MAVVSRLWVLFGFVPLAKSPPILLIGYNTTVPKNPQNENNLTLINKNCNIYKKRSLQVFQLFFSIYFFTTTASKPTFSIITESGVFKRGIIHPKKLVGNCSGACLLKSVVSKDFLLIVLHTFSFEVLASICCSTFIKYK